MTNNTGSGKVPEGYIKDARNALIPIENVREIDLKRDALVKELIAEAREHAGILSAFRNAAQDAIGEFVSESARRLKTKVGGIKGNVTLMSFDGQYKVVSACADQIVFDERLGVAKELIDKCIKAWSSGASTNLLALVNKAFQVDAKGGVNTKRILELKQLDIDDPTWKKAMEAISQAVQIVASKNYLRFYEREPNGEYKQIALNIAN
ncbi:MAG: DUF3164 family protein [Holophagales bacterium]|jgi:signal transduction histidine kinase|nr:DUF3164 family protein [Holophagales bacterium]